MSRSRMKRENSACIKGRSSSFGTMGKTKWLESICTVVHRKGGFWSIDSLETPVLLGYTERQCQESMVPCYSGHYGTSFITSHDREAGRPYVLANSLETIKLATLPFPTMNYTLNQ
ncbi:hypothetical protein V1477_006940 [Vespula maculifrons]